MPLVYVTVRWWDFVDTALILHVIHVEGREYLGQLNSYWLFKESIAP
jgi:hypothetical protein